MPAGRDDGSVRNSYHSYYNGMDLLDEVGVTQLILPLTATTPSSTPLPALVVCYTYIRELVHEHHTRIIDCHSAHTIQSHVCSRERLRPAYLGIVPLAWIFDGFAPWWKHKGTRRETRDSFQLKITHESTRARTRNTQHPSRLSLSLSLTLSLSVATIRGLHHSDSRYT